LDIFTVDAIHTKGGNDIILEINDTASGLLKENEVEDQGYILDIVAERVRILLAPLLAAEVIKS